MKLGVVDVDLPGNVHFAEHARDAFGNPGYGLILLGPDAVYASNDLGTTWKRIPTGPAMAAIPQNAFTTASGIHFVQGMGWAQKADDDKPGGELAPIARFDRDWNLLSVARAGDVHWHGTAAIGEAAGTIMFAEYPDNYEAYQHDDPAPHVRPSRVWRSRDDGASWHCVFTAGEGKVRHFHTCVPDPRTPRRWWLSAGDRPYECHVWCSDDDGDTWVDVTNADPDIFLPSMRKKKRSIHRLTDMHFDGDHIVWGTDDMLGDLDKPAANDESRPGARIYRATLEDGKLKPEQLGWVGLPVRSMIDLGSAWIFLTEAKKASYSLRPRVVLVFKDDPHRAHHLCEIENHSGQPTGFTYSVASRVARNGIFFSNRGGRDAFPTGVGALRWEISFS